MKKLFVVCLIMLSVICAGCEQNYQIATQARPILEKSLVLSFISSTNNKADILFVIDNSASTLNVQTEIQNALSSFTQPLWNSGLDFQVGVISTDSYMSSQWFSNGWNTQECTNGSSVSNGDCSVGGIAARLKPYVGFTGTKGAGHLLHKTSNRFIAKNNYQNFSDFDTAFKGNARLGTGGWPIESSILSILKALESSVLQSYNSGFVRQNAALQIVTFPVAEATNNFGGGDEFGPRAAHQTSWGWDNIAIDSPSQRLSRLKNRLTALKGSLGRVRYDVVGDRTLLPNYAKAVKSIGQGEFLDYRSGNLLNQMQQISTGLIETVEALSNSVNLGSNVYEVMEVKIGEKILEEGEFSFNRNNGVLSVPKAVAQSNAGKKLLVIYR